MRASPYILIFSFTLGDAATTIFGLNFFRGALFETNLNYIPMLTAAVLIPVLALLDRFWPKQGIRPDTAELVRTGLALVALAPIINNVQVILAAAFA